jgi:putative endonuclease
MTGHNKNIGEKGETIAAEYLTNHDYSILRRNFSSKFGEIDIVAKKDEKIYFIEVKTRSNLKKGMPHEAINYRKKHQLRKAATYFLLENNYATYKCSIGMISILFESKTKFQLSFYPSID